MGSFKISTGPRPSLLHKSIPSLVRMWQSVSQPLDIIPREDQPSPCSSCLNTIYLAITEAPLTAATLTFNLENCLALVVCFHYCQLFRFLCRLALWLTVPQSMTRGPPVAFFMLSIFQPLKQNSFLWRNSTKHRTVD